MKNLLTTIKSELQALSYIRPSDVFITFDDGYLPDDVRLPCIGIKDGKTERTEGIGGCLNEKLNVSVVIWQQIYRDESSIIGDESAGRKGVLDIAEDVHDILNNNLLDLPCIQAAFCYAENASELMLTENQFIQRKVLSYEYEREC